jgi:6-phosphogluconolactonase (cycloisomerase 2 family)
MSETTASAFRGALALTSLFLYACGGGGGGDDPPPPPPATFTVGGTVTGLATGASLVVRFQSGTDVALSANGGFTFATALATGTAYTVVVATQPSSPAQTCTVTNGSGNVSSANVSNIAVNCVTNTYAVRGSVNGLAGGNLVLRNNGGNDLAISGNGPFSFASAIASGAAYSVTIQSQPSMPLQTCSLANAAGTVAAADVTNVAITCVTQTFSLGGSVAGLAGGSLVLRNNGGADLTISANGPFSLGTAIASGSNYSVTIQGQPSPPVQTCTLANGAGTVAAGNVSNIAITCVTHTFTVGGTVTGITGGGVILRNNGGDDLNMPADGAFVFSQPVASGSNYAVSVGVRNPPGVPRQRCTVIAGTGTVTNAAITHIDVGCRNVYTVSGTLTGLEGAGLVLQINGGHNLALDADGAFTFATTFTASSFYRVTVSTAPTMPRQTCTVAYGGLVLPGPIYLPGGDISDITVDCETDRYAYVPNIVSDDISAYTINSWTGELTPLAGTSTFAAGAGPSAAVSDPLARFLYVANRGDDTISGYAVNNLTGALTPVPGATFAAGGEPIKLAIDSEGMFLFATNYDSNDVSVYQIQADGSLVETAGSPFATGHSPVGIVTTPAHQCCSVYVANSGDDTVSAFVYDQYTGALSEHPGSPHFLVNGHMPLDLAITPSAEFVYVTSYGGGAISTFELNLGQGNLIERMGSPTQVGGSPCGIAMEHNWALYVTDFNTTLSTLDVHFLDQDYLPEPTPFYSAPAGAGGCSVATDLHGQFVYVTSHDTNTVAAFKFGADLSVVPGSPFATGAGPQSMAIRRNSRDLAYLGL